MYIIEAYVVCTAVYEDSLVMMITLHNVYLYILYTNN